MNTLTKETFITSFKRILGSILSSVLVSRATVSIAADKLDMSSILRERNIPVNELYDKITKGRVFSFNDFLTETEINDLRKEIESLDNDGKFKYSGLTNRANTKQDFGKNDRQIYPIAFDDGINQKVLNKFGKLLRRLRHDLSVVLDRPSLNSDDCEHESYFSKSSKGASLPLHMDERHEEIKGRKGWLSSSRRSISWLIYLSDKGWSADNGGALRSYPQSCNVANSIGCDEGNLQIGWVKSINKISDSVFPVFLDINRRSYIDTLFNHDATKSSSLYIKDNNSNRKYITKTFDIIDANTGSARTNFETFLYDKSNEFYRIEEIDKWAKSEPPTGSTFEDFLPTQGTLVLFDSVSLPHEVQITKEGQRLALAGWFHETIAQT